MLKKQKSVEAIADRSGVWLHVSVYLILIAFFIVLNSIASPIPSKTEATTAGLSLAFSGDSDRPVAAAGKAARKVTHHETLVSELAPLFRELGLLRLKAVTSEDGSSYYRIPRDMIFRERSFSLRDGIPAVMSAISRLVSSAPRGYRNEVVFWMGVGDVPLTGAYSAAQEAAIRRANALSRTLDPVGAVTAGIHSYDPQMVVVEINTHPVTSGAGLGR